MAEFRAMVITEKGRELIASALSGKGKIKFTKVLVSDRSYNDNELLSLETLADVRQSGDVARIEKTSDAAVKIESAVDNARLTEGYYVRTIALYAKLDGEKEIIYAACGASREGWMPPFNGLYPSGLHLELVVSVQNADKVTLTADPAALATVKQIWELRSMIDALRDNMFLSSNRVYGVEADYEKKSFVRLGGATGKTYGADFDDADPWKRRVCILADDGTVLAYEGEDGFVETGSLEKELTVNGVTYPVGTSVQVMVEQPKFYYRVDPLELGDIPGRSGNTLIRARYYVTALPESEEYGFKLHPAFIENGKTNDCIYLSANAIGSYLAGINKSFIEELREDIHAHGSGWESAYIATVSASQLLMLIEFADTDIYNLTDEGDLPYRGENYFISSKLYIDGIYFSNYGTELDENRTGVDGQYYIADHDFGNTSPHIATASLPEEPLPQPPYYASGIAAPILNKMNGPFIANYYYNFFGYSKDYDWLFVPSDIHEDYTGSTGSFFGNYLNNRVFGEYVLIRADEDQRQHYSYVWEPEIGRGEYCSARMVFIPSKKVN